MIFLLQGDLGDQITMLPAVKAYRDKHSGPKTGGTRYHNSYAEVYVLCDPRVKDLMPKYEWLLDEREMPKVPYDSILSVNVWDAVKRFGKDEHPTRMFFRYLDLEDPGEAVRPEIVVDESAPAYDYVIAPFANDPARAMPDRLIRSLIDDALHWGIGGGLAVVGDNEEALQRIYLEGGDYPFAWQKTLHAEFGESLSYVAGLMRNASKAVITVDSMPNRLAHAAGVENHVLLCSDVVPEAWATHSGARVLYGPPESWTVDKVLELLPG